TSLDVTDCASDARDATIVAIESPDCPGFLFELTNALTLCGFCIRGADIRVSDRTARDTFGLTEFGRRAPLEPERIRELHTVAVLIQQFTQWVQSSADPATALVRFRQLLRALIRAPDQAEAAIILQNPEVLRKVARVLGLSRHLWEDALRHQGLLIPWLADPDVLAEPVSGAQLCADLTANEWGDLNDFRSAILHLNQAKDRHLFRIELRHVLGHTNAFGEFSREVTQLAEAVLLSAAELGWEEFEKDSPAPACAWTLAGLGKLGGIEMGYASDIELLLIYDAVDQGSARWFERLLRRVKSIVQTRYDGIFDIDLRMRPWGQAGSAAVPLQQFREYYSAEGNAWPFERQAMIKLRPFGPDRKFGERVTALRDRAIYDGRKPDLLAMQGLREEQVRQHVRPSTIHAKLSEGCLVDLEYAVQGLQLRFGHKYPELRSSNTADAILVAGKLELITAEQLQTTLAAHQYLRQLIDCLRMVRGNARDLVVPERGSPQGHQLTRRLKLMYGDEMNLTRLAVHQDTVQRLIRAANAHCS
ncbi:MAG: glutamine synthetase adenylyltransferase, partial [Fuerstiella sp.]|nr:glutamine synthetase adenylyltransferase [Fuerstiella sp.]